MTDARDELAELIRKGLESWPHGALFDGDATDCRIDLDNVDLRVIADAILAAGWRAPLPHAPDCARHVWTRDGDDPRCVNCGVGCEHRMIVHGGACGNCGQMPPAPTEEERAAFRDALSRAQAKALD